MRLQVYNTQKDLKIFRSSVKTTAEEILRFLDIACDEIAIHFVGKRKIQSLHKQFFDDPTLTDCITLPYDRAPTGGYWFLGEIFICPYTAIEYVGNSKDQVYTEVTLYLIHGVLHLLGYDDITGPDRKKMRRAEARLMKHLHKVNKFIHA